jgi:anaerobic ribonucleoside-triphosphate reductase
MQVIKRDGTLQEFDSNKIKEAIEKAFEACGDNRTYHIPQIVKDMYFWDGISIEEIQDIIIETLRDYDFDEVASVYSTYRKEQSRYREIVNKITANTFGYSPINGNPSKGTKSPVKIIIDIAIAINETNNKK